MFRFKKKTLNPKFFKATVDGLVHPTPPLSKMQRPGWAAAQAAGRRESCVTHDDGPCFQKKRPQSFPPSGSKISLGLISKSKVPLSVRRPQLSVGNP